MVIIIESVSGIGKPGKQRKLYVMVVIVGIFFTAAVFGPQQYVPFLVIGHGKPSPDLFHTAVTSNTNFMFIECTNMNTRTLYGRFMVFQHNYK